ncbi:hypothetical protein SLEP1_g55442 [Rubroshorea leprosula]|uniref:Uncharacterized protein n=1 Tax=Rubroshorea leprosula TaxID=152421 RepID=A0AAV5MGJ5_9ROSI|nr:hypothetical protein SLEP1_g55442 [Rubroshorea leprosula]
MEPRSGRANRSKKPKSGNAGCYTTFWSNDQSLQFSFRCHLSWPQWLHCSRGRRRRRCRKRMSSTRSRLQGMTKRKNLLGGVGLGDETD